MITVSDELILRPLVQSDAQALLEILGDDIVRKMTVGFPPDPDLNTVRAMITARENSEKNGTAWQLAVEFKGQLAGLVGLNAIAKNHNRAAIDYVVSPEFRGMGIATRAVGAFVPVARERFSLHRISATVFADNAPSRRVLEKNGFVLEGVCRDEIKKDGIYRDVAHYGMVFEGDE